MPSITPIDRSPSISVWQSVYIIPTGPGGCNVAGAGGGNCEPMTSVDTIELILQYLIKIKMTTIVAMVDNTEQTTIRMFAKNFGSNGFISTPSERSSSVTFLFSHFFPSC